MKWNEVRVCTPHLQNESLCLQFFDEKRKGGNKSINDKRIISIFGRNGSGKTTISNALLHAGLNLPSADDTPVATFLNVHVENGEMITEPVELEDSDKAEIYVYNEAFVDKYVRVKDNENLEAIVMLSDDPDLGEHLEELEKKKTVVDQQIEKRKTALDSFESKSNQQNELNIRKAIENQLKSDGSWASIGKIIHNYSVKQSVSDVVFNKIHKADVSDGTPAIYKRLTKLLESDLNNLAQIRQKNKLDSFKVTITDKNDFNVIDKLLNTSLKTPSFSGLQERIMQEIAQRGRNQISANKELFSGPDIDYCPTCFRTIDANEKETIVQVITQVLDISKQSSEEQFINNLKSLNLQMLDKIEKDTNLWKEFPSEIAEYNEAVHSYNGMVSKYEQAITNKINNPYVCPDIINNDSGKLYSAIVSAGKKIQRVVKDYNVIFENEQFLLDEADLLNLHIAKYNNEVLFEQLDDASSKHCNLKAELESTQVRSKELENQISDTKLRLAEQKIALDQINMRLAHVFMDRDRLKLIDGDNCYRVQSRGEFIKTSQLSVGERNAISLCYFFSRINSNVRADQAYKRPSLVVLDDPISSFDFENKIGILSLLREELEKILLNNCDSKVLVMTHDAEMFQHVAKIYSDIEERRSSLFKHGETEVPKIISQGYQLSSGILKEAGAKRFNDYAQ